jgi:hypothetical protein
MMMMMKMTELNVTVVASCEDEAAAVARASIALGVDSGVSRAGPDSTWTQTRVLQNHRVATFPRMMMMITQT